MSAESDSRRRGSVKGATLYSPGRRAALQAAALSPFGLSQARAAQSPPAKTLRYAFEVAETGFDLDLDALFALGLRALLYGFAQLIELEFADGKINC